MTLRTCTGPALLALAMTFSWTPTAAGRQEAPPPDLGTGASLVRPAFDTRDGIALPGIDPDAELDAHPGVAGAPLQVAIKAEVWITPDTHGTWERLPDGDLLWRLPVAAPGATDLNFGFTRYRLPAGASLWIVSEHEGYFEGPYTAADNAEHGQLWTPVVPSDRATIELLVPAAKAGDVELELTAISQGFRDLFNLRDLPTPNSGACNIDVVCPQGDLWRDEIRSVAAYGIGGTLWCTGTLIMDVPRTFTPWFLTANHCLNAGEAASVTVYWNFQTSSCGGARNGSLAQNQTGATYRASRGAPDFYLMELNAAPSPAFNVYFAGWDNSDVPPSGSVCIHHPSTDEKAISFNTDALTTRNSCIGGGNNTHWNVNNWEMGTTEPGSSGSGLWDPVSHLLVGTLSGGGAACGNMQFDCFGRFGVSWGSGATAAARLRDWLDPDSTSTTQVAGSDPGSPGCVIASATITGVSPSARECVGTTLTFSGSGMGEGMLTLDWDLDYDGTTFSVDASGASAMLAGAPAGTRTVALRVTDSCTMPIQQALATVSVTLLPLPTPTIIETCLGADIILDAGAGYSGYAWDAGPGTRTLNIGADTTTTYTVTVTDANGCQGSDSHRATVPCAVPPGEVSDVPAGERALRVAQGPGGLVLTFDLEPGATTFNVYADALGSWYAPTVVTGSACHLATWTDLGAGVATLVHDVPVNTWFILTASNAAGEGPTGQGSFGVDRMTVGTWSPCGPF